MTDTVIANSTHVARKAHQCDHCSQPINPGEQYERTRAIWDGSPGTFRCHLECRDCARKMWKMRDYMWDEGILLSADIEPEDHEWIREEYPIVAQRLGFAEGEGSEDPSP